MEGTHSMGLVKKLLWRRLSLILNLSKSPNILSIQIITLLYIIQPACSQHHSLVNTPPILYVPERNWRIEETEKVGQIITRIRAEDPENDDLVFGLEPHFLSNDNNIGTKKLPFRIDPLRGIVYLNDSLVGRGGENFFLYITVSDGDLTAKNEVFVNILAKSKDGLSNFQTPPSVTRVIQNISQILPPFDTLPGVQSVRNKYPNERPISSLSANSKLNHGIFTHNSPQFPHWPISSPSNQGSNDIEYEQTTPAVTPMPTLTTINPISSTGRIRLTLIKNEDFNDEVSDLNKNNTKELSNRIGPSNKEPSPPPQIKNGTVYDKDGTKYSFDGNSHDNYSTNAVVIPVIIISCGIFFAGAGFFGFLYRKRLCAISKKLKNNSKEEMSKKSNQSNLSSNLTDDSRNSMVMQHWSGPTAFNNRYVPWERDQQQNGSATFQPPNGDTNFGIHAGEANVPISIGGLSNNANTVVGIPGNGIAANSVEMDNIAGNVKSRWEYPRHKLKFFNILGEGAFGQVWRCEAIDIDGIEGVTTVAVKTLKENATEIEKKDLMSEIEVMKSLKPHINVVRLLGCCTDKDPIFAIMEFVNCGKLQTYLRNSRAERHYGNTHGKSKTLTSADLTSFMYQVAKGMDYLTSRGIIHRDLAARNILITEDHTCKVADFGFARDVITSKIYERKSEGKLPIRWMAIESLYDNVFSLKSDIWSFGVLMWEIVTLGSTPYPGISASDVMRKVRDGYRLEKPDHCRRELYNIMYYCWSSDAGDRPTFLELVQMLDKLLYSEMDYIELERFPDHNYYNILNLSGEKL
ncbi:tyrosine kinase receptor Cad96Ca isoform X3 [Ceratitis capitata]|uniref:tyrosine kinase receptor Cad96Ca isoform X3 n=1 Tax=Ceratitis capitata TaxID=7213 RepID=UPI000A11E1A8|nr:tyrosine kinase receptor Cad96Ca isoform X3 [Ceratitis capitata]